MATTTKVWPLLVVARQPMVSTPGSEPPLVQTVGHWAGSSPMLPPVADKVSPSGASAGWAASCCNPAKFSIEITVCRDIPRAGLDHSSCEDR